MTFDEREAGWLEQIGHQLYAIPADEEAFTAEMAGECTKLNPALYDLA